MPRLSIPGFSRPNSWAWLMCTQLASTLSRSLMLCADAELGLEQHPASEGDLVRPVEFAGRAGVDRDSEPGPDVALLAQWNFAPTARRRHNWCSPAVFSAPKT